MNKKSKLSIFLSICAMFLLLVSILNYGSNLNLGVIPFHPMSYCHMFIPFIF